MTLAAFLCGAILFAPAAPTATPDAPDDESAAPAPDYDAAGAAKDVDTLLHGTGLEYTRARGRLSKHPAVAGPALVDRLHVSPPPNPAERKRLLDVLSTLRRPEDLKIFADQLQAAVVGAEPGKELEAAEAWREVLRRQGPAAIPVLAGLVGNRELPTDLRSALLADLVAVTPHEKDGDLVALVGVGDPRLQRALRQALARRSRSDAEGHASLSAALDATLQGAEPDRMAGLLAVKAAITKPLSGPALEPFAAVAVDPAAPFPARVAAVRVLVRAKQDPVATTALEEVARGSLAAQGPVSQAAEILGSLAAEALPPEVVANLVAGRGFQAHASPRLARLGYRHAPAPVPTWLPTALENPWPSVRAAAFERVDAPCERKTIRTLSGAMASVSDGGDPSGVAARAAAVALGRCQAPAARKALLKLMRDDRADTERRAVAARTLVRAYAPDGPRAVAETLADIPPRAVARRLASALRHTQTPTAEVAAGLCAGLEQSPEVARASRKSLRALFGSASTCPGRN